MLHLVKMSLKLLFRNKGFWFFLLAMPVLSVAILHVKSDEDLAFFREETVREIKELTNATDKVAYYGKSGEFVVKVYDAAGTKLSEAFLENLAQSGLFLICRAKTPELVKSDVDAAMEKNGFEDRMGAGLYLSENFDESVLSDDISKSVTIYLLSEDERFEIFEREVKGFLGEVKTMAGLTGKEGDELAGEMAQFHAEDPEKTLRSMARKGSATLTKDQVEKIVDLLLSFADQPKTLGAAVRTILVADFIMSMDNILSLAGVANTMPEGKWGLIICGLLISIPIVLFGAQIFLLIMLKLPVLIYFGAGILGYTAVQLIVEDRLVGSYFAPFTLPLEILSILAIWGIGWYRGKRRAIK